MILIHQSEISNASLDDLKESLDEWQRRLETPSFAPGHEAEMERAHRMVNALDDEIKRRENAAESE